MAEAHVGVAEVHVSLTMGNVVGAEERKQSLERQEVIVAARRETLAELQVWCCDNSPWVQPQLSWCLSMHPAQHCARRQTLTPSCG